MDGTLDLSTGIFPSIVMDCQPYNLKGVMSRDHTKYTYFKQRKVHILQQLAEVLALLHNCGAPRCTTATSSRTTYCCRSRWM